MQQNIREFYFYQYFYSIPVLKHVGTQYRIKKTLESNQILRKAILNTFSAVLYIFINLI